MTREVRLQEIRGDRPVDERGATGEPELTRPAEEVVVPPAGESADLFLGIVPDPEPHLARRRFRDVDEHRHLGVTPLVLLDAHGAEEVQADEVSPRPVEEALLERLPGRVGDLSARHRGVDVLRARNHGLAEHARRAALEPVGDAHLVVRDVDLRFLRHVDARVSMLAVVRAQIRVGPAVRLLGEHPAGSNGQVIQQEAPLGERRLGAAERHVDRDDLDRWAFLDEDDRHERVAALRQLEVTRDARMVVPARPVELTQPIEIRAEHDGVEEGPGPPHREPRPGLGAHRAAEVAASDRGHAAEAQRPQAPGPGEVERLELHGRSAQRRERREQGDERGRPAHGAPHVTGWIGSAIVAGMGGRDGGR